MIQICNYSKSGDGIDGSDMGQSQFNIDVNGSVQSASAAFGPALEPIEFTRKEKEIAMTAGENDDTNMITSVSFIQQNGIFKTNKKK